MVYMGLFIEYQWLERKAIIMPDNKDVEFVQQDLEVALKEAEKICGGLIEVAQKYNEQKDEEYYDIEQFKKRLEIIRKV